ncbi:MAG: DivIVA domain-containing protein [Solirubrobacteraceae bacterium]
MDFDRQAIERRDFPIGRRGYDTAAVDAHLRALAAEFQELRRAAEGGNEASLASTAGTHVQSIIEAAEKTAADIERSAQEAARELRESAVRDAERAREEALEKARAHVGAVAHLSTTLLERVGSMDAEVNALVASLRAGAGRLGADLAAVEAGMGELYGAAGPIAAQPRQQAVPAPAPPPGTPAPQAAAPPAPAAAPTTAPTPTPVAATGEFEAELSRALRASDAELSNALSVSEAGPAAAGTAPGQGGADLDGARLIALNMALNGESRAETERYLAENFELPDRLKLVDEVYAAIEG